MRGLTKLRILLLQLALIFVVCTLVFGFTPSGVIPAAGQEVEQRIELEHRITVVESRLSDLAWMQRAALAGLGGLLLEMLVRMKKGEGA